jgi:hypothetical protein
MHVASGADFRAESAVNAFAGRFWLAVALLVVWLTCSVRGAAQTREELRLAPPPAQAAAVWYRFGEGCPDGTSFIELLHQRSIPAQLAQVGDRIDFVVTLGVTSDGARGRLERQAEQGTVALREVQGKTCEGVADALALSLALTWEPPAQRPAPDATPSRSQPPADPVPAPTAAAPPRPRPLAAVATPVPQPSRSLGVGLDGSLWTLTGREPFFGGGVFGELRPTRGGNGFRPLIRLGAKLAFSPDLGAEVQGWIGAAGLEGCPLGIPIGFLQLRPCTGFDWGVLRVAGTSGTGARSNGFWAAWSTHARLSWETGATWGLEVQGGVIVPLTQYELTVGQPAQWVAELRRWGIAVGMAAHWAPM